MSVSEKKQETRADSKRQGGDLFIVDNSDGEWKVQRANLICLSMIIGRRDQRLSNTDWKKELSNGTRWPELGALVSLPA